MSNHKWTGQTRGNLLGYRIFAWILNTFGLFPCYFLLLFVAFYFVLFSPRTSRNLYLFYRNANQFNVLKSLFYIYKNYLYLGQSLIDKTAILIGKKHFFSLQKVDYNRLIEVLNNGKPTIFLMSHLGNFEAAGNLVDIDKPINLLMFKPEIEQIKIFLESLKIAQTKSKIIEIKNDGSHIFEMSNAIENNEIVALHADRHIKGSKVISVSFFNKKALLPYGPFYLSSKFQANVIAITLVKTAIKEYTLEFKVLKPEMNAQAYAQSYAEALEKLVVKYPESWFNYHYFWEE